MKQLFILFIFTFAVLNAHETPDKMRGMHSLASYHECDLEALLDTRALKEAFLTAIEASGAHTLSYVEHVFDEGGYTLVALLAENHATLHTYPNLKSCFIDFFACDTECNAKLFHHTLIEYLTPGLANQNLIERN